MGVVRNAETFPLSGMPEAWESRGFFGSGNVVGLLDSLLGKTAIVCGNANTVFDDIQNLPEGLDYVTFAANDIGVYLPRVDHLVSLHDDNLVHWTALRVDKHERSSFRTHSDSGEADYRWEQLTPCLALSGYFAMQIAWLMGCSRIILCGCPGDATPRFFDMPDYRHSRTGTQYDYGNKGWRDQIVNEMRRVPEFACAVRSMSGWTKTFFGSP